jgi:hypothetical protein
MRLDVGKAASSNGNLLYSVSEIQAFTTEHGDRAVGGSVTDITDIKGVLARAAT